MSIPAVLLGGDHGKIAAWRHAAALGATKERRPDLLAGIAERHEPARARPDFVADYVVESIEDSAVAIRHRLEGHRWRFEVAEKNGRRQLLHRDHTPAPTAARAIDFYAVDAYDAATREARQRGMVD